MVHQYWFKPKTFGYGATPSTWEGWLVLAVYVAVLSACAVTVAVHRGSLPALASSLVVVALATTVLTLVSVWKTDGIWRWRWGPRKISGKND
jgi:hypothetical protein